MAVIGNLKAVASQWELRRQALPGRVKSGKSDDDAIRAIGENYSLVGGIARWALDTTTQNSIEQIDSAARWIDFETLQHVMATQHVTKNDDKELAHRLVEWVTPMDADDKPVYRVDQDPLSTSV
eukprot:scaffold39247_cov59-Attheya_sp.AAC.2